MEVVPDSFPFVASVSNAGKHGHVRANVPFAYDSIAPLLCYLNLLNVSLTK